MNIQTSHSIAFKEWACVVRALAQGEQTLILRKGGIHEKGKKFSVSHHSFFLFPTFEHQNPEDLNARGKKFLTSLKSPAEGKLEIKYFFEVTRDIWVEDISALLNLNPYHVWSERAVRKRFQWGEDKGLYVILGRLWKLSKKVTLEMKKNYGGCRSWIDLGSELSLEGRTSVLPDERFHSEINRILKTLS